MGNFQEGYCYGISGFQLAVLFFAFETNYIHFCFQWIVSYISEQKKERTEFSSLIFQSLSCAHAAVFINIMLLFQ